MNKHHLINSVQKLDSVRQMQEQQQDFLTNRFAIGTITKQTIWKPFEK